MNEINMYTGISDADREKELSILANSYKMYEKTKKETERSMKNALNDDGTKKFTKSDIDSKLSLIKSAQDDIIEKVTMLGGNISELLLKGKKNKGVMTPIIVPAERNDNYVVAAVAATTSMNEKVTINDEISYSHDNGFDLIPLPSNGECYRNKMSRVPVAPLCANDENMIAAPNLYRDDLVLDYILRAKVLNNEIDPMDMLEGDREAILLYLRSDGYGNDYPISAKDKATGESFDTVVDLSKLKYKQFKLTGDANGWFDFTLPSSKHEIKFRFLTHRDNVELKRLDDGEKNKVKKEKLREIVETLDFYIDDENSLDNAEISNIRKSIRNIEKWYDELSDEEVGYTHALTNRLEMSIMSVDMNTNREYIHDFVQRMNVKDASALRRYISQNEPGVDYHFFVQKPESLGGGSQEVFLQFDKYLFLNVP